MKKIIISRENTIILATTKLAIFVYKDGFNEKIFYIFLYFL
ncbi:hypothetical protein VAMP_125n111 [Candidatus Vampirococcus lugosii]|uniref:Uncharacterized protein n=1 Tax=Candidatus Vampirococcus lugosii TaxID=2789015 RepID=A0ABS5QME8_9BACT|nr:hypothetical protein [Candidatus Vampirococcus lugosii]